MIQMQPCSVSARGCEHHPCLRWCFISTVYLCPYETLHLPTILPSVLVISNLGNMLPD